jgi:hypothetical protein
MRQFCSARSNKGQHAAQSLRFECAAKREITAARHLLERNSVYGILRSRIAAEEMPMNDTVIKLRLNQQQLELMDRTIAQGIAPDRAALVRLALREYAATRTTAPAGSMR